MRVSIEIHKRKKYLHFFHISIYNNAKDCCVFQAIIVIKVNFFEVNHIGCEVKANHQVF